MDVSVAFQLRFTRKTLSLSLMPLSTFRQGASLRNPACDGQRHSPFVTSPYAVRVEGAIAAVGQRARLVGIVVGVPGCCPGPGSQD